MLDTILKLLALAGFLASLAVLAIWISSGDLVTVIVIVVAFAVYDFLVRPYLANRRNAR